MYSPMAAVHVPPCQQTETPVDALDGTARVPPHDADGEKLARALDILEAPWPRREEMLLREQFRNRTGHPAARSMRLVEWVLATGLERFEPPPPLPPIRPADVRLVCWMALEAEVVARPS
jgi:hypothetical protein